MTLIQEGGRVLKGMRLIIAQLWCGVVSRMYSDVHNWYTYWCVLCRLGCSWYPYWCVLGYRAFLKLQSPPPDTHTHLSHIHPHMYTCVSFQWQSWDSYNHHNSSQKCLLLSLIRRTHKLHGRFQQPEEVGSAEREDKCSMSADVAIVSLIMLALVTWHLTNQIAQKVASNHW